MSKVPMSYRNNHRRAAAILLASLMSFGPAHALQSDREQPLDLWSQGSKGSLGDGETVLIGQVEIRQGSLLILADEAKALKKDGKVIRVTFTGSPATLEQEIEEQGMVNAQANRITYEVKDGTVELAGAADVTHPQYSISGEVLTYDLDTQHFEGTGSDSGDGRLNIRLEPEVASGLQETPLAGTSAETVDGQPAETPDDPPVDDANEADEDPDN